MVTVKPEGFNEHGIRFHVEMAASGSGKVFIKAPDGSEVECRDQALVKIEKDRLAKGDWLVNVLTGEVHRVLDILTDPRGIQIKLQTPDGYVVVPWDDVPDALRLIVNT